MRAVSLCCTAPTLSKLLNFLYREFLFHIFAKTAHRNTIPGLKSSFRKISKENHYSKVFKRQSLSSLCLMSISPVPKSFADLIFSASLKYKKTLSATEASYVLFSHFLAFKNKILECALIHNLCLKEQSIKM